MVRFSTKEEDVVRISTSIYISNIPDSIFAKDIFYACKQYGHVVDSFIPFKRDKNGKRFGFVRFINVFNKERLVDNLCTVWIGRYKMQANIAHFQRSQGKSSSNVKQNGGYVSKSKSVPTPNVNTEVFVNSVGNKSYLGAVNGGNLYGVKNMHPCHDLVLGDECLVNKDL
nr:nucleotide-binding alpha-beta plait domain-containing protein [Tanacetum cinerariifolium]